MQMHQAASNLVEFNLVPFQLCYLEIFKDFKISQPHISKRFECIHQFELKFIKHATKLMSSMLYNPLEVSKIFKICKRILPIIKCTCIKPVIEFNHVQSCRPTRCHDTTIC